MRGFVDVHSHMVPSGDDGVRSVADGLELLRETARRGTTTQFATPHANRVHPVTPERRARVESAHAEMAGAARRFGLDLQLGWELSAEPWVLDADPRDFRLGRLDALLLEFPLPHLDIWDLELVTLVGEHAESAGLVPILAHPERCAVIQQEPELLRAYAERGWLVQVNASSLLSRDLHANRETGWWIIANDLADLVASDGHRATRPPYLDAAHAAVAERHGPRTADRLLRGDALRRARRRPERV